MFSASKTLIKWIDQFVKPNKIYIRVLNDNTAGLSLYHRLGFVPFQLEALEKVEYDEVLNNLKSRDLDDSKRKDSPLIVAEDALEIDNSFMSMEDQLIFVKSKILHVGKPNIHFCCHAKAIFNYRRLIFVCHFQTPDKYSAEEMNVWT